MNTNMTGFRSFINLSLLVHWSKVAPASEGLNISVYKAKF